MAAPKGRFFLLFYAPVINISCSHCYRFAGWRWPCPDSAFFMSYMSSFCALGYRECDSWQGPLGLLKPPAQIFRIRFVLMTLGRVVCSPSPPTPLSCPFMEPLAAPDFGWVLCPPSLAVPPPGWEQWGRHWGNGSCSSQRVRLGPALRRCAVGTGVRSCSHAWYHPLWHWHHPGHCHHNLALPWGSASQLQRRKHSVCTGSTTTSTPQFPKPPPNSHPALSGWDENSPGPNSSALKPHW